MRFPGTRIAALLVWALAALPVLFAQEVAVSGFVRLDHYGGVAEESFYTNERVRLTALSQLRADDEAGFWSAFLEVVAHLQYDDEGFSVAPGALTARAIDNLIRQAYVSFRFDAFDVEIGKKFVHWGKVDFLSPLDVINHVNLEVPALGDLFEGPLADPLLHVTAYPTDDLAIELVYVPFLAPYVVTVDDLDIDVQFGLLDIDMAFRTPEVQPFSEYAHSIHGAVSYSTFLADLQLSYSWFRDQIPDIDLSGLEERIDVLHEIEGTIVPAYGRAHNIGLGASVGLDGWVISADVGAKFHQNNLDGSRIDVKNPEIRSVLQVDHPFAIGAQQVFATAGVIHRLVLFDEDRLEVRLQPVPGVDHRLAARPRAVPARAVRLVPDQPPADQLPARATQRRSDGGVGHQRGGPPPGAAGELRDHRHLVGGRRRKPVVHARRPRQHQDGPAAPGRRQGQRVHPDHAPLLTPPRRLLPYLAPLPFPIAW